MGDYHDLYVLINTLLLPDIFEIYMNNNIIFETFESMCLEIYDFESVHFTTISMASSFKMTKVKLDLLTDVNMLLMVEKSIRGGIYHFIYRYLKASNKYMRNYDKNNIKITNHYILSNGT